MRKMKNSGVPWIGQIPVAWKVCPLKTSIKWKSEKNHADAMVLSLYRDYGIVPKDSRDDNFNVTSLDTSGYKYVEVGDLVINKMKAWQGSIAVSDYEGIVSPAYHVCQITNERVFKRYLHYLLRNSSYLPEYMRLSTGLRIGQWDLGFDDFKNIPIILPDIDEQKRIVAFLDTECTRIDAVIEQTRSSIEEYKKLKQSVITQVVTKGIRPNRKMKDSGIEWIGEIPEEWDVVKVTRILKEDHPYPIGDGDHGLIKPTDYQESGIPYLRVQNLGWATELIRDGLVFISEEKNKQIQNSTLRPRDVLIAKTGATIGKTGIVPEDMEIANTTSHIGKITVKDAINAKFVFYLLSSQIGYRQLWDYARLKTTRPELSIDEIKSIKVLLPQGKDEQDEIVSYLDNKCVELDKLVAKKEQCLSLLQSLKMSLIYEYVTGKKEVV